MLYPSIDELLKVIDSKYSLVTIAAKRARKLQEQEPQVLEKYESHKFVGKALEEIYAKKLHLQVPENVVENNQKTTFSK